MSIVFNSLTKHHDFMHMVIAVLVLGFSLVCALLVFQRGMIDRSETGSRRWIIAAGIVTGLGVWATHFIAMLGYQPGFPVKFDAVVTLMSGLIAVIGLTVATAIASNSGTTNRKLCAGFVGSGTVIIMHYFGMTAMKDSVDIAYDPRLVLLSIVVGVGFYTLAYSFRLSTLPVVRNMLSWTCAMLAILGIHFIGTAAMTMTPLASIPDTGWLMGARALSTVIATSICLILLFAALAAGLDSLVVKMRNIESLKLSALADSSQEALFMVSANGKVIQANMAAETMLGIPRDDMQGTNIFDILQLNDLDNYADGEDRLLAEHVLHISGGHDVTVEITTRAMQDSEAGFTVFAVRDLTRQLRQEAKVRALAYRDTLTGLPNRAAFNMTLEAAIRDKPYASADIAVFIIDVDEFKEVNDQFGHSTGDSLLKIAGRRISGCLSPADMVARLGGDEFAIILRGRTSIHQIKWTANKILKAFATPITLGTRSLSMGASIGIALVEPEATGTARVLNAADRALYAAKEAGRGCYRVYDSALHEVHEQRRDLETALHKALEGEQFVLHFQPKVCSHTRAIVGREALIRWNRPGRGIVYPDNFIPVAEQSLLINDIGRWTIRAACEAASEWDATETVAVNLSARQFLDPGLVEDIRNILHETGLNPSRLELEITETALILNKQLAATILMQLKAIGIKIALDDFGTGYSSMSYVQSFPFDRLKIDRSFVAAMNGDRKSRAIVEAIISLAHSLDIPVVAEGVETEEQASLLRSLLCEEIQGFLIARPEPFILPRKAEPISARSLAPLSAA
jgi:diguanylate cyclase (GGDEF)-like protein/PAS domain S-box-containing protein